MFGQKKSLKMWFWAALVLCNALCANSDPIGVRRSVVTLQSAKVEGWPNISLGVIVDAQRRLIATYHLPFHGAYFGTITVLFDNGSQGDGTLVFADPVLGFSLVQVDKMPASAQAVDIASYIEKESAWLYSQFTRSGLNIVPMEVTCYQSGGGVLPFFQGPTVASLNSGVIFNKCGKLLGINIVHEEKKSAMFVPATFIQDPLKAIQQRKRFRAGYLNLKLKKIMVTEALSAGLMTRDQIHALPEALKRNFFLFVEKSDQDSLQPGDVLLSVNGKVPHFDMLYAAPRKGKPVHMQIVRQGKKQEILASAQYFPREKSGIVSIGPYTMSFIKPFFMHVLNAPMSCEQLYFYSKITPDWLTREPGTEYAQMMMASLEDRSIHDLDQRLREGGSQLLFLGAHVPPQIQEGFFVKRDNVVSKESL